MYKQKVNVHKLDLKRIFTRRRDAPVFHIKHPFCEKYKKNVFYYGANLWNELPVETRKIETYNKFKLFKNKTNVTVECILYYNWYHTVLLLNSIVKPNKII